jgi:4-diphosphocytidyl-2-C-methyl-D-erythritol kinase
MLGAKALARAKINLFLHVGGIRHDGFHDISSVMQSIELCDELFFRRTDASAGKISIKCSDPTVPTNKLNLIWQAIEVFDAGTGAMEDTGIEIFVNKRIPIGAGLAGGSADAAAALLALDHIYELELAREFLLEMAAEVGSDVPFCLQGGTALATGRGERLEPVGPLPPIQVVLASPEEQVSTPESYERYDRLVETGAGPDREAGAEALERMLGGIGERDLERVCENLLNDLESATIAIERLEQYKDVAITAGALGALMTGSGPTVFAIASGLEQAAGVAWELEKIAPVTIITSFADRGAQILK